MKIVVCVKQVLADQQPYFKFLANAKDVDLEYATFELNEADLYAVEEALRLCEAAGSGEVIVVTAGDESSNKMLQKCLAMGAARAMRVWSETLSVHDPIATARALAKVVTAQEPAMVLCGVQSSDSGQQATGPALASVLGLPCISAVTKVEIDLLRAGVHRELDGGLIEIVEVNLPVLLTIQTGLNTPRSGSFRQLMLAKKTPIPVLDPGDVGSRMRIRRMSTAESSGERAQMLEGGPAEIAERIIRLVREADA